MVRLAEKRDLDRTFPVVSIRDASWYLRRKGWLSPLFAVLATVALAPVIGVLYLLVRLTSSGPGFYSQVRLGLGGRRFVIYKLRTMTPGAEIETGPVWATRSDPRITPIGRFLRRFHLDELPQIINVIKGDMCFVGPRPERPEIAVELARDIPRYFERLAVKPGITGMAQIHLPADSSIASVRRKLSYDLAYICRGSLWLDLRVVLATCFKAVPFGRKLPQQIGSCRDFLRHTRQFLELPEVARHAVAIVED